jgi:hypothetical protein
MRRHDGRRPVKKPDMGAPEIGSKKSQRAPEIRSTAKTQADKAFKALPIASARVSKS